MRILWNENGFQAEFSQGAYWQEDLDLAKSAGFRTAGPPEWVWSTQKASVLNTLRELKPKSGLTLTELALEKYKVINERERQKAELKKQYETARKAVKKAAVACDPTTEYDFTEKGYKDAQDFPPTNFRWDFKPPASPKNVCLICDEPVWFYEKDNICLHCEIELDKTSKVRDNLFWRNYENKSH
jgi:hypothetical protein